MFVDIIVTSRKAVNPIIFNQFMKRLEMSHNTLILAVETWFLLTDSPQII